MTFTERGTMQTDVEAQQVSEQPAPGRARRFPRLPRWAYALIAVGLVAAAALSVPIVRLARIRAEYRRAEEVAETTFYPGAWAIWDAVQAKSPATDKDRARFALALLRGGDFRGATILSSGLTLSEDKYQALSDELKRYAAAFDDYKAAREALLQGKEQEAWPRAEKAMQVLRNLRRPPGPASRPELLIELAGDILAPGFDGQQILAAQRFLDQAGTEVPRARSWLVRARILAFRGEIEGARSALDGVDGLSHPERHRLHESWQLLALEARAAITHDPIDLKEIAARAATIPERWLRQDQADRRAALMALGKK
jgi:hypothetical protein